MTVDRGPARKDRLLIYRLGSIGDTMVALPALKLIARRFPDAERVLLTNEAPANGASMETLLAGSGLVDRCIAYKPGERRPGALARLAGTIRALRADRLIYLTEPKGGLATWRDIAFFRACGITRIIGAPLSRDMRTHRPSPDGRKRESEGARLARCIAALGDARLDDAESWRPFLSDDDRTQADRILDGWNGAASFIALAVGARVPAKDWGEDRWAALIDGLEKRCSGIGLMLVGGPADRDRAKRLSANRRLPILDRCGEDLRVTMALLRHARLAVTSDGGPMHIAAGLGVPVVAVFSGDQPPGVWFPAGKGHVVFHPSDGDPSPSHAAGRRCGAGPIPAAMPDMVMSDIVLDACLDHLSAPRPS